MLEKSAKKLRADDPYAISCHRLQGIGCVRPLSAARIRIPRIKVYVSCKKSFAEVKDDLPIRDLPHSAGQERGTLHPLAVTLVNRKCPP
ncbi:MAG: hypothetical protein M8364_21115 [Methylobacter sp.]|uniref:hypothetical protein n=1 Tax=Methylobacter sp. TaxID=2051955 RepID=UPI00258BAF71|nr:hypothetical protein [Methylobacter sp.]MCL7423395.1 hypothetical protein [Methylobacter sp.]